MEGRWGEVDLCPSETPGTSLGGALWEAYATLVAAYRDAAEKLREGGQDPSHFPTGR
jgi:hypothetical protein